MAPGTASMLRARRRDVNVKPNRRLDRKSSRGMLYENEELRLRTININAEVERGQSDIKKLRRENEQLRREIWGLRDEYDRLEGLLGELQSTSKAEDIAECISQEERNAVAQKNQKLTSPMQLQSHRNSMKLEFDGLSVVDEETDDHSHEVVRTNPDSRPQPQSKAIIIPSTKNNINNRVKSAITTPPTDTPIYIMKANDNITELCKDECFPPQHLFTKTLAENDWKLYCPSEFHSNVKESHILNQRITQTGYVYFYPNSNTANACESLDAENSFVDTLLQTPHSPSVEQSSTDHIFTRGGPDLYISGAYPVDSNGPQFPMGGNLEQLLHEVHQRKENNATKPSRNTDPEHIRKNIGSTGETDDKCQHPTKDFPGINLRTQEHGHDEEKKQDLEELSSQIEILTVDKTKSEVNDSTADTFRSQLSIQLQHPKYGTSESEIKLPESKPEATAINQSSQEDRSCGPQLFDHKSLLGQCDLYKKHSEYDYQSFIASTPELSSTTPQPLPANKQNISCFSNSGTLSTDPFYHWRNTYQHSQGTRESLTLPKNYSNSRVQTSFISGNGVDFMSSVPKISDSAVSLTNIFQDKDTTQYSDQTGNSNSTKQYAIDTSAPYTTPLHTNVNQTSSTSNFSQILQSKDIKVKRYLSETSTPPSPVNASVHCPSRNISRMSSTSQPKEEEINNAYFSNQNCERLQHLGNYHNIIPDSGPSSPKGRKRDMIVPPSKMSVIVGDTQQGQKVEADHCRSSSLSHEAPSTPERRARMSLYSKLGSRTLTRSISLDPTRCRLVVPGVNEDIALTTGGNNVVRSTMKAEKLPSGTSEKTSVPWCACWGNGCV